MCGIAGIVAKENGRVSREQLIAMTDIIAHRGPDGEGHWMSDDSKVGFGHRRLSIVDLSQAGKQPMHYLERYTITFNGEIYNYIELRQKLRVKGYEFISESDTEVLLALYAEEGVDCLQELDGMFAFAIWDKVSKILFCARDRFGEKPFHYYQDEEQFVFASEIKQFWTLDLKKSVNESRLVQYVEAGQIDDENDLSATFYNGIKRLEPAHYLLLGADGYIKTENYWSLDLNTKRFTGTIEQASEEFLEIFRESVRLRLRSDVPVGSSLSGGLDSSSIVMLIDSLKGETQVQKTFSARFKDFHKDEGRHIESVVAACKNVEVHYCWPDRDYFESVLDRVIFHQDEPFGSASIIAQYAVMEKAKQNNVTVLLDGQGADEYLAGYLYYYHTYLNQLFYSNRGEYADEFGAYNSMHGEVYPYRTISEGETLRMKLGRWKAVTFGPRMPFQNALNIQLARSTTSVGLVELLRYADRNSMAHSREVRLPFLSHKLVEFVFSLPESFKIHRGWTKFVLRKAMDQMLPSSITWRVDKIGFEPPQQRWMHDDELIKLRAEKYKSLVGRIPERNTESDFRLLVGTSFMK